MAKIVGVATWLRKCRFFSGLVLFPGNKMRVATPTPQGSDRLRRRPTEAGWSVKETVHRLHKGVLSVITSTTITLESYQTFLTVYQTDNHFVFPFVTIDYSWKYPPLVVNFSIVHRIIKNRNHEKIKPIPHRYVSISISPNLKTIWELNYASCKFTLIKKLNTHFL